VLGDLILTNGVTNANFYSVIDILFISLDEYFLRFGIDEGGIKVQKDDNSLQPGNYYICTSRTPLSLFIDDCRC
jgi:hypothetical protein